MGECKSLQSMFLSAETVFVSKGHQLVSKDMSFIIEEWVKNISNLFGSISLFLGFRFNLSNSCRSSSLGTWRINDSGKERKVISSRAFLKDQRRSLFRLIKIKRLCEAFEKTQSRSNMPCKLMEAFIGIFQIEQAEEWRNKMLEVDHSSNLSNLDKSLRTFDGGVTTSSSNAQDVGDGPPLSNSILESRNSGFIAMEIASNEKWRWRHLREVIDSITIIISSSTFGAFSKNCMGGNSPWIDLFSNLEHLLARLFREVIFLLREVTFAVNSFRRHKQLIIKELGSFVFKFKMRL